MTRKKVTTEAEESGTGGEPTLTTKVEVFLDILTGVGALLSNVLLQNKATGRIVTLLGYAVSLIRDASQGVEELNAVNKQIQALVDGNRGPSDEEWQAWDARLSNVDARFAAVREQLR